MRKNIFIILLLFVTVLMISGCDLVPLHMRDQPKYEPLEPSTFFDDGMASRPLPPDTIPRGEWGLIKMNEGFYTGQVNGEFVEEIPVPVTQEVLERGQERFDIFCSPCHSRVGDGQGMIVQRGFPQPPSYHIERLRQQPDGYFYDVITNGFGVMYSYDARIPPADRWAIVAYIRALQFSQNAPLDAVPENQRPELEEIQ